MADTPDQDKTGPDTCDQEAAFVARLLEARGSGRSALIPILQDVQRHYLFVGTQWYHRTLAAMGAGREGKLLCRQCCRRKDLREGKLFKAGFLPTQKFSFVTFRDN